MKGTLHEDQYIFFYHIPLILLRMRNISDKRCKENKKSLILCSVSFCFENRAV